MESLAPKGWVAMLPEPWQVASLTLATQSVLMHEHDEIDRAVWITFENP